MFVFASAVTDPDVYERAAAAGVGRLREDDPSIEQIVFASVGSIFRNYNLIIDQVKDRDDVEALVLIHQDAEIQDPGFSTRCAPRSRTPRSRSSAAPAPSTSAASPGGRARSPGPRSPTATTSSAAARSRPSRG